MLLSAGAAIDAADYKGRTPLMAAATLGYYRKEDVRSPM